MESRRSFLKIAGLGGSATAFLLMAAGLASAQEQYPTRTITVINPWASGGPADALARPLMEKLSERLGQSVLVENRPGANGTIGTTAVVDSDPDGYTLLFSHTGPISISPAMSSDLPYDPLADLTPITQIVAGPLALVVRPDFPASTLEEFVAEAKANPGAVTYGSSGLGSTGHLAGVMLGSHAGIDLLYVPYPGAAPVMTDLLGGRIDASFTNISGALPYIESGDLRAIAVTTPDRSELLPDVPAIPETYSGYLSGSWYGLMAPNGTPEEIIQLLYTNVAEIVREPEFQERLKTIGLNTVLSTPDEHANFLAEDLVRWAEVVEAAGLSQD